MERLTQRNGNYVEYSDTNFNSSIYNYEMFQKCMHKLATYEDLEEQGLLLRLPCKVGDTVWKVNKASRKITGHKVIKFEIEKSDEKTFTMQIWFNNYNFCFYSHFGKTVFLTKDEAEKKLEEMED